MPTKTIDGGLKSGKEITIGIDQSLTGFALTILDVNFPSSFYTWIYKSPYFGIERLSDIREWLQDTFDYLAEQQFTVKDIAMEGTVLASQAAIVLGELSAVVRLTIFDYYATCDFKYPLKVPPMTLKKYAAGKGNAKKQEMLLQIFKRWGIEFNDDNAADSYALARLVAQIHGDVLEKHVVDQMMDPKYRDQPRF